MSETINTLNLLEVQARVSEADEQIIRADERAKVIEEFAAKIDIETEWRTNSIAYKDFIRIANELKEKSNGK